jgi:GNAT superfamily N-acetyltransferase
MDYRIDLLNGEALGNRAILDGLSEVLVDCVEQGASVSFMSPFDLAQAYAYWQGLAASVSAGDRLLWLAHDGEGRALGTVQVVLVQPPNQPHRGDVAKLLVSSAARNRGVGNALMEVAEVGARQAGKSLLVLDTGSAEAERLYRRRGWVHVGEIPDYALWPQGGYCATQVFYKRLVPV